MKPLLRVLIKIAIFSIAIIIVGFNTSFCTAEIDRQQSLNVESIFGVGYADYPPRDPLIKDFKIAELYAQAGIKWIKTAIIVNWRFLEPNPPVNDRHIYLWDKKIMGIMSLDGLVQAYQDKDMGFIFTIRTVSPWATRLVLKPQPTEVATPPKDNKWRDFEEFVFNLVERYDGDGINDMPGLKTPIVYYELESEAQHAGYWQGTPEEYIKLLQVAYGAAKRAYPSVKLILSGINMGDIFDDIGPTSPNADVTNRVQKFGSLLATVKRNDLEFIRKSIAAGDYYDIIEFHWNRDYMGAYKTVDFIKQELQRHGLEKPIWAGNATSAPWLSPLAGDINPKFKARGDELSRSAIDSGHTNYESVNRWLRAEQAKLIVKKYLVGMELGLKKVIMETTVDWPMPERTPYHRNWHIQGMVDASGKPKPAYYTLKLMVEKLDGFSSVERLSMGEGFWVYKVMVKDRPIYVLWFESGKISGPGEKPAEADVGLSLDTMSIKITHIVTEVNKTMPVVETKELKGKTLNVRLTDAPVIIEELQ